MGFVTAGRGRDRASDGSADRRAPHVGHLIVGPGHLAAKGLGNGGL